MNKIGLTIGILLLVVGSILSLLWYPIIGVDSASEAADQVRGTVLTGGIPLKFKGRITGFDTILGQDVLYIQDFKTSNADIPIVYDKNASLGVNDEVLVEGVYIALIYGWVQAETESGIEPAKIERLPSPLFYLAVFVLIGGIVLVPVSVKV